MFIDVTFQLSTGVHGNLCKFSYSILIILKLHSLETQQRELSLLPLCTLSFCCLSGYLGAIVEERTIEVATAYSKFRYPQRRDSRLSDRTVLYRLINGKVS